MAKKKSKPSGGSPKPPAGSRPKRGPRPKPPELQALEELVQRIRNEPPESGESTPADRARGLVFEALDSPDPKERVALARKALEVDPDHADAYLLLAEEAKNRKEALAFLEQGVAAGERALGPEAFQGGVGHFWGLIETRPYMRARERLAHALWETGRRDEAVAHVQDMIRLNPNDNQGLRYTLSRWLYNEGRDDELAALLKAYKEATAAWAYTKALFAFRQKGDTPEARKLLQAALKANKHVPAYLLGRKELPVEPPELYGIGDNDEAVIYAAGSLGDWKSTPGATAWLKASSPEAKAKRSPKPKTEGPLPLVKKRLERLPQTFDVWQADFREFGPRIEEGEDLIRPWFLVVISRTNGLIEAQALDMEAPSSDRLWDVLAEAMRKPIMDDPHRPTELQVRPDGRWDALAPHLDAIGVNLVPTPELDQIDLLLTKLNEEMSAEQPPGLLEMPGIDPDRVAGFYEAAAGFYRKAPWRKLGFEAAIKVECPRFDSGPWYAVVMGQGGMTIGVALYDDLRLLKKLWAGTMSDEENARETVALTVTFDDETDLSDADLDAIEQYDFEVAGPDAFPSIFRKERGMSMRPPLAWELELMEGCLRALPDFIARHRPDDHARHATTVGVAGGSLDLALSWVAN